MSSGKHTIVRAPDRKPSPSVFLFVSLYLVLLAFFILLNSIAKIQKQKSVEAMKSITNTFSDTQTDRLMPYIEQSTAVGSQISTDTFFAPVGKLAKEMLSLTDADIVETGNTMVLKIPVQSFYVPNSPDIQAKQRAFMNTLADELTKMGDKGDINVEFSIGLLIGSKAGPDADENTRLGLLRAGNFARVLSSMGVDGNAIYVGLLPDSDPNVIQMTFTAGEKQTQKEKPF